MRNNVPTESELENTLAEVEGTRTLDGTVTTDEGSVELLKSQFFNDKGGLLWYKVVDYLLAKYHIITIGGSRRDMFIYRDGEYVTDDNDTIRKEIHRLIGSYATDKMNTQIIEAIKDLTSIARERLDVGVHLINLNNGILNTDTWKLEPHNPKHIFFTKIPVNYNPAADCPTTRKFLSEILQEEDITIILEVFGYALYREYKIKKAFIFVGEGNTGKTTLLELLAAFVGARNVSGVSLQRIATDKFAAAGLYNKHVNLYDDLSAKDVSDNGPFKMVTGGGTLSAEKKYKDQFKFTNYAKLIFACNTIPDVKDATDDAYFLRWIVITFTRIIEDGKKDTQLIYKMTTPEELSGLLNLSLKGLRRLLANQKFSHDKDTLETKAEMMRSASPIARFVGDCVEESAGEWVSKEDMYHAYCAYVSKHKIPAMSAKMFGGRLPLCAPHIAEFKPKSPANPAKQVLAWRNVRLKHPEREVSDEELDQLRNESFGAEYEQ